MATSLLEDQDKYSEILLGIARYAGLAMPLLVVLYGIGTFYEIVPRSDNFSLAALILTSIAFLLIGVSQYVLGYRGAAVLAGYLIASHVVGGLHLIWVSGFNGPLLMFWIVLISISEMFFGKTAMLYSMAALLSTAIIGFAVHDGMSFTLIMSYMASTIAVIAVSLVVNWLRSVQSIEHDDLKKTQENEDLHKSQLLTLINSISEPIISISARGTVRVYNAAALSLLDTNETLAGKHIDDIFHLYTQEGEPVKLLELLPQMSHLVERDDLSHRFGDGEEIRLAISAAPIRQAFSSQFISNEGYLFIFRDVTKTKSLEEERDEFISVISHELRTPVTIVEGTLSNAKLLLDRGTKPDELKGILNDAHEQVIFLASMVNDLGTLSRAERGIGDSPEEIDIKEMLHDMFNKYEPRAQAAGLALDLDASPRLGTVTTSRLYLEEILQNFITNAIKYTKEGKVTIIAKRTKTGVYFGVKDTGIGISKTDLKRVFEKFYRSEDYRTRETSGTGLGLYVVNKLAKKLRVKIGVESRLNHGSTFSFELQDK